MGFSPVRMYSRCGKATNHEGHQLKGPKPTCGGTAAHNFHMSNVRCQAGCPHASYHMVPLIAVSGFIICFRWRCFWTAPMLLHACCCEQCSCCPLHGSAQFQCPEGRQRIPLHLLGGCIVHSASFKDISQAASLQDMLFTPPSAAS